MGPKDLNSGPQDYTASVSHLPILTFPFGGSDKDGFKLLILLPPLLEYMGGGRGHRCAPPGLALSLCAVKLSNQSNLGFIMRESDFCCILIH